MLPKHDISGIVDEMTIEHEQHMEEEGSIVNPSSLVVDKKGKGKVKDEHTMQWNARYNGSGMNQLLIGLNPYWIHYKHFQFWILLKRCCKCEKWFDCLKEL